VTNGVGERRHLLDPLRHLLDAGGIQCEPVDEGRIGAAGTSLVQIGPVGLDEGGRGLSQGPGNGHQRPVLGGGIGPGEHARGSAGPAAHVLHELRDVHR
jgi:hypothetical protein